MTVCLSVAWSEEADGDFGSKVLKTSQATLLHQWVS